MSFTNYIGCFSFKRPLASSHELLRDLKSMSEMTKHRCLAEMKTYKGLFHGIHSCMPYSFYWASQLREYLVTRWMKRRKIPQTDDNIMQSEFNTNWGVMSSVRW